MPRTLRRGVVLLVLLGTLPGCASVFGSSCPEIDAATFVAVPESGIEPTCAESKLDAAELLELATTELQSSEFELGYRHLALIHILHPTSAQDGEAFILAARAFRKNHFRSRRTPGTSVWNTSQPEFMFAWLAEFFRGQEAFPQRQADALFLGMHFGILRDFVAYAEAHAQENPALARWVLHAEKDNGIVYSVTAVRKDDPAA